MFLPSATSDASFAVAFVVAPVASPAVVGAAGLKKRKLAVLAHLGLLPLFLGFWLVMFWGFGWFLQRREVFFLFH